MPLWKCYYHAIWATKFRERSLTPTHETIIFTAIEQKCVEMKCAVLAINAAYDHIHVALSIPPALAVGITIGNLKGASSREVNVALNPKTRFHWQSGYGLLTYSEKALPTLLDYITRQKEHHQNGTTHDYLERTDD